MKFAAIVFLALGLVMIERGYRASRKGEIIPATYRADSMTGGQAMVAGVAIFGCGILILTVALRRRK